MYGSSSRRENIKLHEICSISIFNLLNVSYEWWQYRFARERHLQSFFSPRFRWLQLIVVEWKAKWDERRNDSDRSKEFQLFISDADIYGVGNRISRYFFKRLIKNILALLLARTKSHSRISLVAMRFWGGFSRGEIDWTGNEREWRNWKLFCDLF